MKLTLLDIADALEERVTEYREKYPRTQMTDAMIGLGDDLVRIIRTEAIKLDDGEPVTTKTVEEIITAKLNALTAPPKKKK